MEKLKNKPEHVLMNGIGFSENDLEANRAGYLSQSQRSKLFNDRLGWIVFTIAAFGLGLFISGFAVVDRLHKDSLFNILLMIIAVWIVDCGIMFYFWLRWRRFDHDLDEGVARLAEGRVKLHITSYGNWGTWYTVHVENYFFNVPQSAFLAFKNGDPYAVYYALHSKTILSAEWLRDES